MTPTQQHLLKLLLEIDEICKKHDIEYFLDFGTIIGAVRHEGFIPWDNDLDIQMTEPNYNKFVEVCEKELDGKTRTFRDNRRDREYPSVFGRYIDLECSRISQSFPYWKPLCGQLIDIFCLVELPRDPKEKEKAIERFYAYDEYCNESYRHYRKKTDNIMKLYRRYKRLGKIFGKERVLQSLEKKIFNQHYEDFDTYLSCSARFVGPSPVIPRYFYDELVDAKFEGYTFKMPGKYIEAMRYHYGETYYLLPEDKRIHAEMTHTGIPNIEYFKDYEPFIDIPVLREKRLELKDLETEEGYKTYKWNYNYYRALIFSIEMKIKKLVAENKIDIEKVLSGEDKKNRKKLLEIYQEYYHAQLHSSVRSWNVFAEVDDLTIETAVYLLLYYCNDFNRAKKLIDLRLSNHYDLSERLAVYSDIINTISEYKKLYFYGRIREAGDMLRYGLEKYKGIKELRISRPEYYIAAGKLDKAEEDIKKLLEHYPDNDTVLKAAADLAYAKGKYPEAKKVYKMLLENSANGFYHLDIRKKLEAMG